MTVLQSCCILVCMVYAAAATNSSLGNLLCENKLESDSSTTLSDDQTINPGQLCLVKNKANITIEGTDDTLVNCTGPRGFAFVNVSNLTLHQFRFKHCGGLLNSEAVENDNHSSSDHYFFFSRSQKVVLFFSNCQNIVLENIAIEGRYQGFAIVLANVFQSIELISISIDGSMQKCDIDDDIITSTTECEGNGILIYQHNTDSIQLSPHNLSSDIELTDISIVSTKSTHFQDNTRCLNKLLGSKSSPIQSAAGITMLFTQNQFNTSIDISDSSITDTFGQIGSGILATFIDTQNFSNIKLSNIILINNNLHNESDCSGNSLQIIIHYFNFTKTTQEKWKPVAVSNSIISNQTTNAAVFISVTEQSPVVVVISFQNVSFTDCQGNDRGVCMLAEALYGEADQNTFLQVELESVTVQRNKINYLPIMSPKCLNGNTNSRLYTTGLLTFVNVDVAILRGNSTNPCVFSDNNGSVFTGIATDFQLEGNLIFKNNQANNGIVFLLFSFCHMFLKPGLRAHFINNRNCNNGREYGSIIKLSDASYDNTMCLFQVMATNTTSSINTTNINVTFISHDARDDTNIVPIDAASLHNCRQAALSIEPSSLSQLYYNIFHFRGYKKLMLSMPECIKFCNKSDITDFVNVTTYPGATFHLYIVVKDYKDRLVPSNFFILHSYDNPQTWTFKGDRYNIDFNQLHDGCEKKDFILKGDPGSGSFFISLPYTRPTLTFNVTLLECPAGFSYTDENKTCECNNFIKYLNQTSKVIECNLKDCPRIKIPFGAWIGHIEVNGSDRTLGYAPICPRDLCSYKNLYYYDPHDNNCKDPHNITCTPGRTGKFCSECMKNYSVIFGSNECRECSNVWLFTYPGFVVIAFIIIVCMYLLRLTLDNGAIGGVILYANFAYVCTRYHKFYSHGSTAFAALFISVINLSPGFPVCFYNGMTDVVKTIFAFIFPIFVWLLVIGIVLVSRHSTKFSKLAKRSPQVLITVIHITFAKSLVTTINALSYGEAYIEHKNGTQRIYIWFLNGTEEYGKGLHLLLLIIAVITTLVFLLPYFILVVFGTCLLRFTTIDKLRPFYDTIYAPYRDRFRWWFGVRQLVLVVVYSVFAATAGMHISDFLVMSFCLIALFALVQAWINPFKSAMINFIDTSYIVNLSILIFIGMYYAVHEHKPPPAWALDLVFGAVPFTFIVSVIIHLLVSLGIYNKLKRYFMHFEQYWLCLWFNNNRSDQANLQYRAQYDEIPDRNYYNENNCELRESLLDM